MAAVIGSGPRVLQVGSGYVPAPFYLPVAEPDEYFAQLEDADGTVLLRLAISSWQGTLQTDQADYLQVVAPGFSDAQMIEFLVLLDAQEAITDLRLVVYRKQGSFEREMARVYLEEWYYNEGPLRSTLTVSGYSRDDSPAVPSGSFRNVTGARTLMRSARGSSLRCDIDWLLRPGMEAHTAEGFVIQVSYINYYANSAESWMQIGERN